MARSVESNSIRSRKHADPRLLPGLLRKFNGAIHAQPARITKSISSFRWLWHVYLCPDKVGDEQKCAPSWHRPCNPTGRSSCERDSPGLRSCPPAHRAWGSGEIATVKTEGNTLNQNWIDFFNFCLESYVPAQISGQVRFPEVF